MCCAVTEHLCKARYFCDHHKRENVCILCSHTQQQRHLCSGLQKLAAQSCLDLKSPILLTAEATRGHPSIWRKAQRNNGDVTSTRHALAISQPRSAGESFDKSRPHVLVDITKSFWCTQTWYE